MVFDLADSNNQKGKFCGSNSKHSALISTERKITCISKVPGSVQ